MRILSSLFFFLFTCCVCSQTNNDLTLGQKIDALKKHECVLIFYHPQLDKDKVNQKAETDFIYELDFEILDSILQVEKKEIQLYVFFALCMKHRSKITDKQRTIVNSKQKVIVCDGLDNKTISLGEACSYLYENSIERKEKIQNPEVLKLYQSADELLFTGPVDFQKIINLLNTADSLEPKNPIILQARGDAKLNSRLDIEGAFLDFDQAILYSLDQQSLEIRYHNRGLSYLDMSDVTKACEDWHRAGTSGINYIEQYCHLAFDSIIHQNSDTTIKLQIKLKTDTTFITSSHNSPEMSSCDLELLVKNINHPTITIKDDLLDFGLENGQSVGSRSKTGE